MVWTNKGHVNSPAEFRPSIAASSLRSGVKDSEKAVRLRNFATGPGSGIQFPRGSTNTATPWYGLSEDSLMNEKPKYWHITRREKTLTHQVTR